jgi:hypothetical protein
MEAVIRWQVGQRILQLKDEGWTRASLEDRWFDRGEDLCRDFRLTEEGTLVDLDGNAVAPLS